MVMVGLPVQLQRVSIATAFWSGRQLNRFSYFSGVSRCEQHDYLPLGRVSTNASGMVIFFFSNGILGITLERSL